ncbi:hypothetical protein M8J76_015034 [Diaphorina citri]|nr:hypothetical protein M8J76_015034 [Diaphorina citri]KAI5743997.1 hypothetical protein M8J77_024651 [Diaphorina citri]
MAEDIDVEAMLEAPYNKGDDKNNSKENGAASSKENKSSSRRHRSRSRSRSGSRAKRSRSRDKNRRHRSRDRHRGERDRSRSRERREKRRKRSLTPIALPSRRERDRRRSPPAYGGSGFKKIISSPYGANTFGPAKTFPPPRDMRPAYSDDLSPEERDARTIFCMQLSQRIRTRDLEEFFSSVGKVRDVRLITCNKTRRFKGIAYIEFKDPESVPLAMGLNGQKLLGIPIIVQPTQAEKNRAGNTLPNLQPRGTGGPMRLYIGSLHFNITEDMLRGIFEPFGKIDNIQLMVDPDTGRSKGYGFITFHSADDAKKAQEQLNGFELAGRPMKVGTVTDRNESVGGGPSNLDTDEMERAGVDLGATGRLQLMFKLAEGTGLELPPAAASALNLAQNAILNSSTPQVSSSTAPPIATQCFLLANMFDPATETNPTWDVEIRDDVIEECNKHGGVLHVFVDKVSPQGNVYVKCPTINTAVAAVNSLHGRWFAGRIITAAYVPVINYHSLFPDTIVLTTLLTPTRKVIT